jgi:AraC-like DNA-binding protein
LETGADDYLTKPFSSKELLVRIKNLLEQRKNLREKFSKEIKIDLSSVAVTSLDNEFIRKAFDVAEKNLSDTEFNTEAFAGEMFLSRSQFHRKLIAVTGQGPGEFLRTIRLKRAAALILENRLSITQISFEVGFNNPSHFAKAFRQLFNCLPTEFINKSNS